MNYRYTLVFLIFLFCACSKQQTPVQKTEGNTVKGIEIQSQSGHFTVALPPDFPTPEADTERIAVAGDSISMYTYISETKRGICMFGSNEYSPETFKKQSPDDMLDNALHGALKQWNGRLVDTKPLNRNSGKGVSYWFVTKMDGKDFYGRFDYLLSKPRMYQVGFMSFDKDEVNKPDIQTYFSSLSVPSAQVQ